MQRLSLTLISLLSFLSLSAQKLFPLNGAEDVCVDTHLVLDFGQPVNVGKSGYVLVYDITGIDISSPTPSFSEEELDSKIVDSLDLSIPSGPTKSRTYGPECDYMKIPYDYSRTFIPTNRNTKPGTPSGTAEPTPPDYQLNIIGGFTDAFHFYPVIARDGKATIYLHNNVLEYGHTYMVKIDSTVIETTDFNGVDSWIFTVKKHSPESTVLNVDCRGNADFSTLQGALDHIPDFSSVPYIINVADGDYEELVYCRNKSNITIVGGGMKTTRIHYANNEVFNPHPLLVKTNELQGTFPSRRAASMFDNCHDITLGNITFATDLVGQAEGLLLNGERILLDHVYIVGSGDAIQANGTIYMNECEIDGGGDTFLSRGSIYAYRCNFRNDGGPFTWVRSTKGHHGLVFVECTFSTYNGRNVDFGRCPVNHGKSYPDTEMVLIDCKVSPTIPQGWSDISESTATFLEFNTRDINTGKSVDTSNRHPFSRQLNKRSDSKIIRNYRRPSFVLNGWKPVVR